MIWHSLIWSGLAAALTVSGPAWGQDYPNRQITILVGIAAGGITDVTTRQYTAVVSKNMNENIIVENRPIAAVQGAAPDGYTLLSVVGSQFCSVPAMGPAPYDPVKGCAPISLTFRLPTLLVVPIDSPAKTVAEFLAWGPAACCLALLAPVPPAICLPPRSCSPPTRRFIHPLIHYRGGAPIMADLITGCPKLLGVYIRPGAVEGSEAEVHALAVDAETRLPALPDVPTLIEAGLGAHRVADWAGVLAPAGTPTESSIG
jgi:tripartite-type tricarboxylate transporter receptor subunit TctC